VITISNPLTSYGSTTLSVASKTSQMVKVNKKTILVSVPKISALCHPKVSYFDAGLIANFKAAIDMANPIISEAKCAESV